VLQMHLKGGGGSHFSPLAVAACVCVYSL
jgi:hypothetical protein